MKEPLDGWDADLSDLLDRERQREPLPHDASNRIRQRVMTSVGVAVGVGAATSAASASANTAASVASVGAKAAVTASSAVAGTAAVVAPKVIATVAAAILFGGASGVVVTKWLTSPAHPQQSKRQATDTADGPSSSPSLRAPGVEPPVEVASVVEPIPVEETVAEEAVAEASELAAAKRSTRPPSRDHDLSTERDLLAQARSALSFRRFQEALDLLDQHRRTFARGRLAEERDSLRVSALVMLGRHDAARDAAQSFHARYPQSIFDNGVKQAIASIR